MNVANQPYSRIRRRPLSLAVVLLVLGITLVVLITGCAIKHVRLRSTAEVRNTFMKVDINPDDYAFFTTGPNATPEAILIIENDHLGDFDSSGWKLRDKQTIMNLLRKISTTPSEGKKYGFPVKTEKDGVTKGMIFTGYSFGKVFVDKEEGVFKVATPAMLDTGQAMFKRSKCSISICQ